MPEQHTASVTVKVYPSGEPGRVLIDILDSGPEPLSKQEVARVLSAALAQLDPVVELAPDDGVDYWIAASGVKLHRFRQTKGPAGQELPFAWCGVLLVDQVRATVGQEKCSRCEHNYQLDQERNPAA